MTRLGMFWVQNSLFLRKHVQTLPSFTSQHPLQDHLTRTMVPLGCRQLQDRFWQRRMLLALEIHAEHPMHPTQGPKASPASRGRLWGSRGIGPSREVLFGGIQFGHNYGSVEQCWFSIAMFDCGLFLPTNTWPSPWPVDSHRLEKVMLGTHRKYRQGPLCCSECQWLVVSLVPNPPHPTWRSIGLCCLTSRPLVVQTARNVVATPLSFPVAGLFSRWNWPVEVI